jgi:hypothetical protein
MIALSGRRLKVGRLLVLARVQGRVRRGEKCTVQLWVGCSERACGPWHEAGERGESTLHL